jgi:predicted site-specific integrase-resolvase
MATATAPAKPKTLRRSEAAEQLGVHPNTVMSWAARGWLETVEMPGGEKRYPVDSVEALRQQIYGD